MRLIMLTHRTPATAATGASSHSTARIRSAHSLQTLCTYDGSQPYQVRCSCLRCGLGSARCVSGGAQKAPCPCSQPALSPLSHQHAPRAVFHHAAESEAKFLGGPDPDEEGRALIISDALASWPALQKWTPAYLAKRFGDDEARWLNSRIMHASWLLLTHWVVAEMMLSFPSVPPTTPATAAGVRE